MKALRTASTLLRAILALLIGIALLLAGIVMTLYSPWAQDTLRTRIIEKLNASGDITARLDYLRLSFPLRLDIRGLMLAQHGDTMVVADTIRADVALMPLLRGQVDVRQASVMGVDYRMGAPDSAMWLKLKANDIEIQPASVDLSTMTIDLTDATLRHATVDMTLRQDTATSAPADTAGASQAMKIRIDRLLAEDLTYKMRMLPTIDSLGVNIGQGTLLKGEIDLGAQTVTLTSFAGTALNAAYIAPDSATIAANPVIEDTVPSTSPPWTVTIDSIHFTDSGALYTTRGVKPLPGLDFGYIEVSDMDLAVNGFYNQATTLRLPLKLTATERCGITLTADGTFAMDSAAMYIRSMSVSTASTSLSADAMMGTGDMTTDPSLPLRLKAGGTCSTNDLRKMFPGYAPYLALLPRQDAKLDIDLAGTAGNLNISSLGLTLPGCLSISGQGNVANVFDPDRLNGDITMRGSIVNVNSILKHFLDPSTHVVVPPMTLAARASMRGGNMAGDLTATTLGGKIALDARYNSRAEGYALDIKTDKFPVNAFVPDYGVGDATLSLSAHGNSFDLLRPGANLDADIHVSSLVYDKYDYRDISLKAALHEGKASVSANIDNPDVTVALNAAGNLAGDTYAWTGELTADNIDLQALNLSPTPLVIDADMDFDASFTPASEDLTATLNINDFHYKGDEAMEFDISDINARFTSGDSLMNLVVTNRDFYATASSPVSVKDVMPMVDKTMTLLDAQLKDRKIYLDTIQGAMPRFDIAVTAGDDNFINDILKSRQLGFKHFSMDASNDSTLTFSTGLLGLNTGSMTLDTIKISANQLGDKMHMLTTVDNTKGNLPDFAHIRLDGTLDADKVSMRINQQNEALETGFDFGAIAMIDSSLVTARFFPLRPIIGYKQWTVNLDNYMSYDIVSRHIDANLKMKGDDSSISLTTDHALHDGTAHADSVNNIVLKIDDIHLQDWLTFNPFAPPISGNLSADINLNWNGGDVINGKGEVSLSDFLYDKKKVSSMLLGLDVSTNTQGTVRAKADLMVDGVRTMSIAGNLNDADSGSPFNLDFSVIRFPLSTVNPFLPDDMVQLAGVLNGEMMISGDASNPKINGEIYFDGASMNLPMTATSYAFSSVKIPVVDNIVTLKDFSISGANENPLKIDGTVDVTSMTDVKYNLSMNARNMMPVNTSKAARGALVFGKAYINMDVTARGNMRYLDLDADLTVLSGTNITYILTEETNTISQLSNADMVKFVNLSDTAAVAAADSINTQDMLIALDAQLTLQNGTTVTVDLPTGSRDKVELQADGTLTYTQSPMSTDGRLVGRLNLNDGYARYTVPVIGEKKFNITQGSYVAFNGDMLNPTLNLQASDPVKVNVTEQGQNSRLVNFDILLSVTGTLERMDVVFNLTTDDDISVANELQSMSAEQRANQAMNMLLYNMYTGPGTTSSANISATGPLFSFLENQINNWAANNIKGVDLSFGIDQYNQTTDGTSSSTMNYSYQVSKTLFNDRFKIVVGGNYTSDTNADENIAENLVNDISFEYYLNSRQTMLLKLFRHTGYESILEGEITETGVGFVYRKKVDRLGRVLPKFIRPKYKD